MTVNDILAKNSITKQTLLLAKGNSAKLITEQTAKKSLLNIKRNNICIIEAPEREKREKGVESLFKEIMSENFLNLKRDLDIQIH